MRRAAPSASIFAERRNILNENYWGQDKIKLYETEHFHLGEFDKNTGTSQEQLVSKYFLTLSPRLYLVLLTATLKAGSHVRSKHKRKKKERALVLVLASSRFTRGLCLCLCFRLCLYLCLRRTCKPALRVTHYTVQSERGSPDLLDTFTVAAVIMKTIIITGNSGTTRPTWRRCAMFSSCRFCQIRWSWINWQKPATICSKTPVSSTFLLGFSPSWGL